MSAIRSVCVYCGSQGGRDAAYVRTAFSLGAALAEQGIRLVYGGGARGVMGAVAQGALSAGGEVTGVIPRFLIAKETMESWLEKLDQTVLTEDMHARKHAMFERSDAFVALPGGIGTLEEIVEVMTWGQLARHRKPIAFYNVAGYWDPMLALLDHMRAEGFVHTQSLVRPIVADSPDGLIAALRAALPDRREAGEAAVERL
jgi:uncharacterized protein (TIGR00730 family)